MLFIKFFEIICTQKQKVGKGKENLSFMFK